MTPIEFLFSDNYGNSFFIKRDDLIPFSFGGNKIRIANEFLADMKSQHKDCIIGYGNARSNLSRAISNLCMSKNIKCHIISPADDDGSRIETFNSLLVKKCDVQFHECAKDKVADAVEQVICQCVNEGYRPYYIYGDQFGKGNEAVPVTAYVKAYGEIKKQLTDTQMDIDYIFLATGTGMTQSGLIAGKNLYSGNEMIVGISIAREKNKEEKVIHTYLESYRKKQEFSYSSKDITVEDSYLFGGYGKYNSSVESVIDTMYTQYGVPLDPTYSGKAFTGMLDYISKKEIKGKKILFIHTGGTPLFFDYIKKRKKNIDVEVCGDSTMISDFIKEIDGLLPVSLSQRTEIESYSRKVTEFGNVLAVTDKNKIVAAVLFYANDNINYKAYITLIGTVAQCKNCGYGSCLLEAAENAARQVGMRFMTLETDFCNHHAIAFYAKRGYKVEFADQKLHMIKELSLS